MFRALTNNSQAFKHPDGTPVADTEIIFELRNSQAKATGVWDVVSKSFVSDPTRTAKTDKQGKFTIELWINSRGNEFTYYAVTLNTGSKRQFKVHILDGSTELDFWDAVWGGAVIPQQEQSAFELHLQNHPVSSVVDSSAVATEPITEFTVVSVDADGKLVYPEVADKVSMQKILGVALDDCVVDASVTVRESGRLRVPTWDWDCNKKLYCGDGGLITQTPPASGCVVPIGFPVTRDTIQVQVGTMVVLV